MNLNDCRGNKNYEDSLADNTNSMITYGAKCKSSYRLISHTVHGSTGLQVAHSRTIPPRFIHLQIIHTTGLFIPGLFTPRIIHPWTIHPKDCSPSGYSPPALFPPKYSPPGLFTTDYSPLLPYSALLTPVLFTGAEPWFVNTRIKQN